MFPLITKCLHPLSLHGEQQKSIKVKCESSIPTTSYHSQWLMGAASPTTQRPRCPDQHASTHFRLPFIQRCFLQRVWVILCAEMLLCKRVRPFLPYLLRDRSKKGGPRHDLPPRHSERYYLSYCCWTAPSVPAALIYVAEPLHLRLLSIKLYNIRPIVHLPALSALPRPVGRTMPARTSKTAGVGGGKRWEGRGTTDRRRRCRDESRDR